MSAYTITNPKGETITQQASRFLAVAKAAEALRQTAGAIA